MFFPERRLVCITVDPDGDTMQLRRFVGKNNDATFEASINSLAETDVGLRTATAREVVEILKLPVKKESA